MKKYTLAFGCEHVISRPFVIKPSCEWSFYELDFFKHDDDYIVWQDLTTSQIRAFASGSFNKNLLAAVSSLGMYED